MKDFKFEVTILDLPEQATASSVQSRICYVVSRALNEVYCGDFIVVVREHGGLVGTASRTPCPLSGVTHREKEAA